MTLFPLITAFGFAVFDFLALNIAHGEESGHVQTAGAVILVFFVHNLFMLSFGGRLSPPPKVFSHFTFLLHPDCFKLSALASRPQFTYAASHRIVCDGCYHARTVPGGEYLLSAVIANRELPGFPEADVNRSSHDGSLGASFGPAITERSLSDKGYPVVKGHSHRRNKTVTDLVREESVGKFPSPTTSRERDKLGSLLEKNRKFFPGGVNGLIYRYFRTALHVRNLLIGHSLKVVEPDTAFLRLGERFNGSM